MQTYQLRCFPFVEVTAHGVTGTLMQLRECVGFGEDRFAHRLGNKPALWRFFDNEDDFAHGLDDTPASTLPLNRLGALKIPA